MKQKIRLLPLIILMLMPLSCFFTDKTYYVIFEDRPVILNEKVFSKGFEIGKIESQKLKQADNGSIVIILEISVEKEYENLMKDNVVFYVDNGKLIYDTIGDTGEPLSRKSKILGFKGKTTWYIFKAKNKLKNLSEITVKKAEELYNKSF